MWSISPVLADQLRGPGAGLADQSGVADGKPGPRQERGFPGTASPAPPCLCTQGHMV